MQDRSYLNPSPRLIVFTLFSIIFKFSCIFMNMQVRYYSYRTIGWMDLSNCTIDYIKTCNNTILGWNQPIHTFIIFSVFINIHEYANYANMITCILTMEWKTYVLVLFSTNFSNLWLKAAEILLKLYIYPHLWITFLMFSWIFMIW